MLINFKRFKSYYKFSHHKEIELDINNNNKSPRKFPNVWKLSNILQSTHNFKKIKIKLENVSN